MHLQLFRSGELVCTIHWTVLRRGFPYKELLGLPRSIGGNRTFDYSHAREGIAAVP